MQEATQDELDKALEIARYEEAQAQDDVMVKKLREQILVSDCRQVTREIKREVEERTPGYRKEMKERRRQRQF